jgi:hypothetical protein
MDLHTVLEDSSGGTDQTQVVDMARVAYKEGIDHIIEVPNYVICHIRRAEQQKRTLIHGTFAMPSVQTWALTYVTPPKDIFRALFISCFLPLFP